MSITTIMNAIRKMSYDEQTLMLIVANMGFDEAIEVLVEKGDITLEEETYTKDLPSEDEEVFYDPSAVYVEGWAKEANRLQETCALRKATLLKAYKGRNHTPKAHRRDKAKAGKRFWGTHEETSYNQWCMAGKKKDVLVQDIKAQMMDLNTDDTIIDMKEVSISLYNMFGHVSDGMGLVYYRYNEDFMFLKKWNMKVHSWMEDELASMPSESEVYSFMEDMYPTMSMSDMKTIVEDFIGKWRMNTLQEAGAMWRYCQNAHLSYRGEIQFDLILAYNKLSDLTRKVKQAKAGELGGFMDKFGVIMFEIVNLKHKLEEMDKANAKFI